jgi:hypothetical protein
LNGIILIYLFFPFTRFFFFFWLILNSLLILVIPQLSAPTNLSATALNDSILIDWFWDGNYHDDLTCMIEYTVHPSMTYSQIPSNCTDGSYVLDTSHYRGRLFQISIFAKTSFWESEKLDHINLTSGEWFYLLTTISSTHMSNRYIGMSWKSKTPKSIPHSTSYLDKLLNSDTNSKLTIQLLDKRDYFNFSIVNFNYQCSNILISLAHEVRISQLI